MKQLFRGLCLLLCMYVYAFAQTESITSIVLETVTTAKSDVWYPFSVSVDPLEELEEQDVYKIAEGTLENFTLNDIVEMQTSGVVFVADSGLYSGFGTAWHRNYPSKYNKGLEFLNGLDRRTPSTTQINLSSLFKTSLSFDDGMNAPSFQSFSTVFSKPLVQVSLGYRNSF